MIYWIQAAPQAAAPFWPSLILSGGVLGAVGALVGLIFAQRRHTQTLRHTRELENERAKSAQQLETERARETSLQKYFEEVGKLLIEKALHAATPDNNLRTVARAQTLAVLEGLDDPERKRILLQFLYESKLIERGKPVISLERANLRGANLSEINLEQANLERANLEGANLRETDLEEANLERARLREAVLGEAKLKKADLRKARLQKAVLRGARLRDADLSKARLRDADLSGAELHRAKNLLQEQLNEAYGDEATELPDYLQRPAHWSKGNEEKPEES
jgi:uncharacterized protein YjbI with pentapeptide repeats